MKEPYKWDYTIRIKTKEGTYEYEDKLENLEKIVEEHKDYEEVEVKKVEKCKKKVLKKQ